MAETDTNYAETTLFVLLGTLLTGVIGGISWLCRKKCQNQECDSDCGICKFHSDNRLRNTIREEIRREREGRDIERQDIAPTD